MISLRVYECSLVEQDGRRFSFYLRIGGDCRYIYPALPEIEEANPGFHFYAGRPWWVHGTLQTLGCMQVPKSCCLDKDKEVDVLSIDRKTKANQLTFMKFEIGKNDFYIQ